VGGVAGEDWVGAGGACTSAIYIVSTACHVDAVQIFVFPSLCCPTIIGLPKMSSYIHISFILGKTQKENKEKYPMLFLYGARFFCSPLPRSIPGIDL